MGDSEAKRGHVTADKTPERGWPPAKPGKKTPAQPPATRIPRRIMTVCNPLTWRPRLVSACQGGNLPRACFRRLCDAIIAFASPLSSTFADPPGRSLPSFSLHTLPPHFLLQLYIDSLDSLSVENLSVNIHGPESPVVRVIEPGFRLVLFNACYAFRSCACRISLDRIHS